ncbi:MAG: FAD binding domain-containing protein [Deinococcales bacterium]
MANDPLAQKLKQGLHRPFYARSQQGDEHFVRPVHLSELWQALDTYPDAKLVAGGTDWVVEINQRYSRTSVQIAIDALEELKGLEITGDAITLGAGLCLSDIEHELKEISLFNQLLPLFASPLIRNRATLGGNLATASPIGDAAPVLLALDAELILVSRAGERKIALKDFFLGYRQSALKPQEIIHSIHIPLPLASHSHFYKFAKRRADDISSVAVALACRLDKGHISDMRIGLGGVAATPVRAYETEGFLEGKAWQLDSFQVARKIISQEIKPISDFRSSAEYRKAMVKNSLLAFFDDLEVRQ